MGDTLTFVLSGECCIQCRTCAVVFIVVNFNLLIFWSEKSSEILSVCSILVEEGRMVAKNYVFVTLDECLYI